MGRREQPNLWVVALLSLCILCCVCESGCTKAGDRVLSVRWRERCARRESQMDRARVHAADPVVRVQVRLSLCGPVLIRACFLREL